MKSSIHLKNKINSIAIGSFDGIHLAHQELIKRSEAIVVIERGSATLTPGWRRSLYTNRALFFYLLEYIMSLSPKEFVKMLQKDFPNLEKIVIGYDFTFGRDKSGDIKSLKRDFKGVVEVVDEVRYDNISIHSRVIRDFIRKSNIKIANNLLGRLYRIDGWHIKGQGVGAKELVPTINLKVTQYTLPVGVFVTYAILNDKKYKAVTFIGHRVSVDGEFAVEVHILDDFNETIKDRVYIEFIDFIREVREFNTLQELKIEILKDIEFAKNYTI